MFLSIMAAATLAASSPSPPAAAPTKWLQRPTGDDIARVYPTAAQVGGVSGIGILDCLLAGTGRLEGCYVLGESPPRAGFGASALSLAPKFKLSLSASPASEAGATIIIPIRFYIVQVGDDPKSFKIPRIFMGEPRWGAAPTFEDVAAAYPPTAGGAGGVVNLRCLLQVGGAVGGCEPSREEPQGKGFAAAAQSLVGRFRVDRVPGEYRPDPPIEVDLTIRFAGPPDDTLRNRRISQPQWLQTADPVQAAALFPVQAVAKGLRTGRGVAACRVTADGHLQDCVPGPADPEGLGFSQAAVIAASVMRMNPWTPDGGPVNGVAVNIPIRFTLAPNAKPDDAKR